MKHIAYLRDSKLYNVEIEQLNLEPVEYDEIFIDKANSKALNRPELSKCMEALHSEVTLHIQSADRIAMSAVQFRKHVLQILETGAFLHLHEERIILGLDEKTKPMLKMLECIADLENRIFTESMLEAKVLKRLNKIPKIKGRKPAYTDDEMLSFFSRYELGESTESIIKDLTITKSTLYRAFQKIRQRIWGKSGKSTDRIIPPAD